MKIDGTSWGDLISPSTWFKHSTSRADSINGHGGWDWIDGGAGNDTIWGGTGNDTLYGSSGSDWLSGDRGNDWLHGGSGRDNLSGGSGNDVLNGGTGRDVLAGGRGYDTFVFDTKLGSSNVDTITDFSASRDGIVLDNWVFQELWPGGLSPDQFHAAAGATGGADADDRIVYDTDTGNLYYDADGSGDGAAVRFAVLSGAPTLTSDDFLIV
jgi:Ca2+-binding RTX toxin-like protein